ncbi:unnamed protein product [Adineta steineri]|uniref:AB hydrolase-1 domain-containing protein n=1 Tax=Adineta steineri TaxID=433720 RepID=A0A813RBQ0_9BILA|nr:unnamed protein product [Adineta steineri]CAF3599749.1 unnamed protein product [Adineta steineri]
MSMYSCWKCSENGDSEPSSPSHAIDQMISLSMFDYADMKKALANNEPSTKFRKSSYSVSSYNLLQLKRTRRIAFRNRFSTIDSLRRLAWNNTSPKLLEQAEKQVFSVLKSRFNGRYVPVANDKERIWTVYSNLSLNNTPIVLLHGFGGGVGLWSLNFDQLCADRSVYAIDLPGFGRSSRPIFSLDPHEVEDQIINMIEDWRKGMGLNEEFILLGHSFGGYISASYALKYPTYIKQLVLIDPWGFARRPENIWQTGRFQRVPTWMRSFSSVMMKLSPLTGLRVAGPLGVPVIKYFRPDLRTKFEKLFDDDRILVYLYHCNAQIPTGEQAFRTICDCFAWAKEPMVDRIHLLDERTPIYFLHGDQSWITSESSFIIQEKRQNVFVETVKGAGHHIYADAAVEFEMYLKRILLNKD